MRRRSLLIIFIALIAAIIAASRAPADDTKAGESKHSSWKAEDFVFTESAGQFRISPDGKCSSSNFVVSILISASRASSCSIALAAHCAVRCYLRRLWQWPVP